MLQTAASHDHTACVISENQVVPVISPSRLVYLRRLKTKIHPFFPLGGHPNNLNELYRGFVGCMRYIQIDRELKQIDNNQGDIEARGKV